MWKCIAHFVLFQKYRRARTLEATRRGSTNSTSRIDSMARILFPLSFGLFNLTYWYSYFHAQKPFDWDDHMLKGKSIFLFFIFQLCIHHEVFCRNFFRTSKSKEKSQLSRLKKMIFSAMYSFFYFSRESHCLQRDVFLTPKYIWAKNTYFLHALQNITQLHGV